MLWNAPNQVKTIPKWLASKYLEKYKAPLRMITAQALSSGNISWSENTNLNLTLHWFSSGGEVYTKLNPKLHCVVMTC